MKGILKKIFGGFSFLKEKNENVAVCPNQFIGVEEKNSIGELSDSPNDPSVPVEINVQDIVVELSDSWKDPTVPIRQYEECAKKALRDYKDGLSVLPFDVLVDILKNNIQDFSEKRLLEIGCSSGFTGRL